MTQKYLTCFKSQSGDGTASIIQMLIIVGKNDPVIYLEFYGKDNMITWLEMTFNDFLFDFVN